MERKISSKYVQPSLAIDLPSLAEYVPTSTCSDLRGNDIAAILMHMQLHIVLVSLLSGSLS